MKWRWLPILAPGALGLLVSLLLNSGQVFNPVIRILIDLGTLILFIGILITALAALSLFLWDRAEKIRLDVLLEASNDRRRFLQRLDHELKNPLTAILAGLANLSLLQESTQTQSIDSVEAQAHRLSRLVADLRKLSDLETRLLERVPVNLTEVLEDAYEIASERPQAASRQLNLSIPRAPWPLPSISGDRDLLFLAIHNLVDNAIKFTLPGDTIEIRAFEDSTNIVIEVADTGPGIPEEEIAHVWEELYRGESARGIPGSGLGLALVRAIITRHGGVVDLRSRPGQGTLFSLRLPVTDGNRPIHVPDESRSN